MARAEEISSMADSLAVYLGLGFIHNDFCRLSGIKPFTSRQVDKRWAQLCFEQIC
jgi:hypothetical protein